MDERQAAAGWEGTRHVPVLLAEVLAALDPRPGEWFVDGTVGGGGHARALLARLMPEGGLIALDRDRAAVERFRAACGVEPWAGAVATGAVVVVQARYAEIPRMLAALGRPRVNGVLLDLGLSSDQLADATRGFSFAVDGPLDLRFDTSQGEPAAALVNRLPERALADLIYAYGEERLSRRIARRIVERRAERPIATAGELAAAVRSAYPRGRKGERIDPATRTFQALRIAVNEELAELERALAVLPECLEPGGRLGIISFHSLEDRRVKHGFREDARLEVLTKKPLRPSAAEVAANPRARSARLRVARRV